MLKITLSKTELNCFSKNYARSERERRGRWLTKGIQTHEEMNVATAWIIEPTVSGVKREVQCLLKIVILAKRNITIRRHGSPHITSTPNRRILRDNRKIS